MKSSTEADHIYLVTPFSIYLVRLDRNQVSEIYLSSAAKAIAENFKVDAGQ